MNKWMVDEINNEFMNERVDLLMEWAALLYFSSLGYRPEASLPHQQQTSWKQFIPFGWFARSLCVAPAKNEPLLYFSLINEATREVD